MQICFKLSPSISPTNQPTPPPLFQEKRRRGYIFTISGQNYNFTGLFVMNVKHIIQSIYFLPNYHVSRMSFQLILFIYYRATSLLWVNCRFLPIITMQVLSTIFQIHCMCQCKNSLYKIHCT